MRRRFLARSRVFLATVLLGALLAACSRPPKILETRWPNGKLKEQWTLLREPDGTTIKEGPYHAWTEEGRVRVEGSYAADTTDGAWIYWYGTEPNLKQMEGNYVKGAKDGIWNYYMSPHHDHGGQSAHHEGMAMGGHTPAHNQESYKNGVPNGLWIGWHGDGSVADSMVYVDGNVEGHMVSYHPNGQLATDVLYVHGVPQGKQIVYDESGKVVATIE